MPPTEAERAAFIAKCRDKIVAVSQRSFILAYDVGCRHIAHQLTTTQERRDLDCNESAGEIAEMIVELVADVVKDIPRR